MWLRSGLSRRHAGRGARSMLDGCLPSRALSTVASVLAMAACSPAAAAPVAEAKLPSGVHLISAASQRAAWCHGVRRDICEDFSTAPVAEIVRFETQLPAILKAKGFSG